MQNQKYLTSLTAILLTATLAQPATAKKSPTPKTPARTTVAVTPFSTASNEEYWFLGFALADTIASRLASSPKINTLTLKQWNAVLRDRDLPPGSPTADTDIVQIGKLLGARYIVSGSYQAKWPELKVLMRVFDTTTGALALEANATGKIERALAIEGELSTQLFKLLKQKLPPSPTRTKNIYAFRSAMICKEAAEMQSLGPRSKPSLPQGTIWQAKRECDKAIALERNYPDAHAALGVLQTVAGDHKGAALSFKRAMGYTKKPGLADLGAFWLNFHNGKPELAIKGLRQAVAKQPGFLHAWGVLGQALNEVGQHQEAKQVWQQYLKLSPGHPYALIRLGYTYAKLGDIDAAVEQSKLAIASVPDDATLYIELASRQIDGKRWKDAEATLRKALKLNPKLAVIYLRLGYIYLETNQYQLATPIFKKALAEAEMESERRVRGIALFDLAKVEAKARKTKQAMTYLDQAVNEGFANAKAFESDPDLAVLRSDPAFVALIKRIKQEQAKKSK